MNMQSQIAHPHCVHTPYWRLPKLDFDTLLVAGLFTAGLFILVLPKVGPLVFILLPVLYVARHPERVQGFLYRVAPILLLPLYCLISTLWSQHPSYTVYYATLYLFTVLCALIVGGGVGQNAIIRGLWLSFTAYAVASLVTGLASGALRPETLGRVPFYGLAGSKNMSGDVAALGILIGIAMISLSLQARRPRSALLGLLLVGMELILIRAAISTGALVSGLVGATALIFLGVIARMPVQARSVTAVVAAAGVAILTATRSLWFDPLFHNVLKFGGKDPGLSGRHYIWSRADVLIAQHPMMGLGYNAFWVPGDLEAEAIWRRMLIGNRTGFNFHNTVLDLLVHLGYVGLALFAAVFMIYVVILVVRNIGQPTVAGNFFIAVLCYELTRLGFESVGTGVFHYASFLMFGALGWSVRLGNTSLWSRAALRRPAAMPSGLPQR